MLTILVPGQELFDEKTQTFTEIPAKELRLEHSLVSLSKWESKWKKPFLSPTPKTREETVDYVRYMTITQNVDPMVYQILTPQNIYEINRYIDDPMTATTFKKKPQKKGSQVITSEIIYYWMIELGIPESFQTWHLNRLLTLIRVCDEKSQPGKKMSKKDVMSQYRSINQARRRRTGTRG